MIKGDSHWSTDAQMDIGKGVTTGGAARWIAVMAILVLAVIALTILTAPRKLTLRTTASIDDMSSRS